MNYEKIILELLDRIKTLEEKVELLEKGNNNSNLVNNESSLSKTKIFETRFDKEISLTQRARNYIIAKKMEAKEKGEESITLLCNDIQTALGVTNRTPCICIAMYDCMENGDKVLFAPPSGKSTTVKVLYNLS